MTFLTDTEKGEIISTISKFYDLEVLEYEEIPVGEESTSFKITTKNGSKFFVKHCTRAPVIRNIEITNILLIELKKLGVNFVVAPIVKNSRTSFDILGGKLYMYPYIEGTVVRMGNHMFPKELVERLTEILIVLYRISPKITTKIPVEDYSSNNNQRLTGLLTLKPSNNIELFKQILDDNKIKIEEIVGLYETLGNTLKNENIPLVLTHGDVTGLNLIRNEDSLYLTDWDGAMLAPAERDLNFLVDNPNFSIEAYLQKTGKSEYRKDIKKYYGLRWSLDSILGNLEILASTSLYPEAIKETVEGIEEYLSYY